MAHLSPLLSRFARDERGVFAVIFGLMAVLLFALGGAVVDYVSLEQARSRAQTALDAAALALQPDINQPSITRESILERAEAIVLDRIGDDRITAEVDRISIDRDNGRLALGGYFRMPTLFVNLVGVNELGTRIDSVAVKGAVDIEVSVALDVTGSMDAQDMRDLRASVSSLVDAIVQNDQTPTKSRVALVPYSQAVNAGVYAEALRGPIRPIRDIRSITWAVPGTAAVTLSANRNGIIRVDRRNHGFRDGEWVYLADVNSATSLNYQVFRVTGRQNDYFNLESSSAPARLNNANAQIGRCIATNCDAVVTSNDHGYGSGEEIYVENARGITEFNGRYWNIANVTQNTFVLPGAAFDRRNTHTANTGRFACMWQRTDVGCSYYRFQNPYGSTVINEVTSCVTERSPNGRNDQPPTANFVGRNYPASANGCLPNAIVPLSDNRTFLHSQINALSASGSTSGSLGVLWSWYMLSSRFGYVWPEANRPYEYGSENLLKAAIIMTDGEFNTVHCNGVVARNSTSGSTTNSGRDYINCAAPNGDPYPQARAYCDAMKGAGIVVYTVGFNISSGSTAANLLTYCASGAANFYLASNGSALRDSFAQIARNISALRIAE